MNKIKIPTEFELMGLTIKIEPDKHLIEDDDGNGSADYRKNRIRIFENNGVVQRNEDDKIETFYHEIVHWILYMMEENESRNNEKFVCLFSRLLHQIFKTAKYEKEDK